MKYLVTGGSGFIGSNFIHRILENNSTTKIINIDAMKTGSNSLNFKNFSNKNYTFVKGDICNKKLMERLITRCTNNYGPRQYPEKLIPKTIISAIKNQKIPLHGKGLAKRQWIHVFDHCDALEKIISKWPKSLIYNISGNFETRNLDIVKKILNKLERKPKDLIMFVADRPGQDRGYRVNANLIKKDIAFQPIMQFKKSLDSTVDWYIQNKEWWEKIPFELVKNPTPWK